MFGNSIEGKDLDIYSYGIIPDLQCLLKSYSNCLRDDNMQFSRILMRKYCFIAPLDLRKVLKKFRVGWKIIFTEENKGNCQLPEYDLQSCDKNLPISDKQDHCLLHA